MSFCLLCYAWYGFTNVMILFFIFSVLRNVVRTQRGNAQTGRSWFPFSLFSNCIMIIVVLWVLNPYFSPNISTDCPTILSLGPPTDHHLLSIPVWICPTGFSQALSIKDGSLRFLRALGLSCAMLMLRQLLAFFQFSIIIILVLRLSTHTLFGFSFPQVIPTGFLITPHPMYHS